MASLEEAKATLALSRTMVISSQARIDAIGKLMKARDDGKDVLKESNKISRKFSEGEAVPQTPGGDGEKKKRKYTPKFDADGNRIKKRMSGYQLFMKETKKEEGNNDFKGVAAKWQTLSQDEKDVFNKRASELPPNVEVLKKGGDDEEDAAPAGMPNAVPAGTPKKDAAEKSEKKSEKSEKKKKKKKKRKESGVESDFE